MNISILGNGSVGKNLANLLAANGVYVFVGARDHSDQTYASGVSAVSIEEAASATDVVVTALPWSIDGQQISLSVLRSLPLAGKIVIDLTNPLNSDWSPISLGENHSAGQETSRVLPDSHVVKAFNTIFADMMFSEKLDSLPAKPAGFFCGNDEAAKSTVENLISKAGFEPIDSGDITSSIYLEQIAHLNIRLALSQAEKTNAAFAYLR